MEEFTIQNLEIRYSPDINYVWVLVDEQAKTEEFAASLGDPSFHGLLRHYNVKNILLDCSKMWVFSIPGMTDYIDKEFAASMQTASIEKISIIVNEDVFSMMKFIFQGIENVHADGSPQIRFFGKSSFYETFDAVSWF